MSLLKANAVQLGQSLTASQNFTWYQPAIPDGTFFIANGNSASPTNLITVGSTGNLTFANSVTLTAASTRTLTLNGGAGSNGLVIDASNNVGIGTASPAYKLDISGTNPRIRLNETTGYVLTSYVNSAGTLDIGRDSSAGAVSGVAYAGFFDLAGAYPYVWRSNSTERMRLDASGLGIGQTSVVNRLDVLSSGSYSAVVDMTTAQMRLKHATFPVQLYAGLDHVNRFAYMQASETGVGYRDLLLQPAGGNLLVGTTSPLGGGEKIAAVGAGVRIFSVQNNTNTSGYNGIGVQLGGSNCNNTSTYHFTGSTAGVNQWYLYGNGTSSFTSDERKKKNIETTRNGYLEDLCKLRVVKYNWWTDDDGTPKELGLIAQEVEQIFPGLITNAIHPDVDGETYKVMKGSVIPFMLLKAIQELSQEIETLKQKVN